MSVVPMWVDRDDGKYEIAMVDREQAIARIVEMTANFRHEFSVIGSRSKRRSMTRTEWFEKGVEIGIRAAITAICGNEDGVVPVPR